MKIRKNIPLIDQHDKFGFWGEKFGGSFIPETLKKPVEDLTILFQKLRKDKNFIKERYYQTQATIWHILTLLKPMWIMIKLKKQSMNMRKL